MKKTNLQFTECFTSTVDKILKDSYSESTPRESFFKLFHLIDKFSYFNDERRYASIHNKAIRELLGTKRIDGKRIQLATSVVAKAVEMDIIKYNNHYCSATNSSLNYTRVFQYTDVFEKKISEGYVDVEIDKRGYDIIQKQHERPTKTDLRYQYDLLKSKRVKFDYRKASNWINERRYDLTEHQYNVYTSMIIRMNEKNISVKQTNHTNRIFTNLTLMKREFRSFITLDDENLVSLDLKSSQPFLLASMILKENQQNKECIEFFELLTKGDVYNHFFDRYFEINGTSTYTQYNSDTYESTIENIASEKGKTQAEKNRNGAKVQFMRLLFKKCNGVVPFEIVMKKDFPKVHAILQKLKKKFAKKSIDYNLAVELQRLESELFLPVASLMRDCFSCHDSLYIKVSDQKLAYKLLDEQFSRLGYKGYKIELEVK